MIHPPIDQLITFLDTADLETTANFYENVMGLPLALDQGSCRIYQLTEGSYVGFCQRETKITPRPGIILTLVTPKVDLWHQVLSNKGVVFEKLPTLNRQYNLYHCLFRDPNGYLIEIQKFLGPDWPA